METALARNGSGTYSVPNTFTAGTTITASDHNENFSDAGAEITNSVAADGQTTMTGPLKAANGTAAGPTMTFGSDTDTGAYRSGANEYSVAAGGTQIHKTSSAGLDVVTGKLKEGGNSLIPPGVVVPYGGASAPGGWLLCYGQAVSRTTYADLFSAISDTYGTGDGSTTFNIPDLRGRVIAGQDDMGGSSADRLTNQTGGLNGDTLGATGGSETHTLTVAQMPAHDHGGATGNINIGTYLDDPNAGTSTAYGVGTTSPSSINKTGSISSQGGGGAHNNVQPTIILNYIIKT